MFSQFVWSFHGCLGYKLKPLSLVLHIVYTIVIIYIYIQYVFIYCYTFKDHVMYYVYIAKL